MNPDHILEHVALLVCLGGLGCAGHVETFGMTAFDIGRLLFFSFWLALLGHFTGKFPTSFRLYKSSPGDGITLLIGVDRKHSNTISKSRLLEVAFCIADFMACTQRSARPFD